MTRKSGKISTALLMVVVMICTTLFTNTATVEAYGPLTMYSPPQDAPSYASLSPRAIQLNYNGVNNGKMYATFEQRSHDLPVFPIYESVDNGESWTQVGAVADTQNGWGMMNCPELFELPQAIGDMPAGTLIIAGNSVPSDYAATKMELYKSNDLGRTWSYVSTIGTGGRNEMGYDPIWEPFFLVHDNKLIVYYSDERDPAHAQKLVHQTSIDGVNWDAVVDDVAFADFGLRPGMPTVARMGNGNYAMTYEMPTLPGAPNYLKITSDPENWNPSDPGVIVGYGGSPYITALGDGRLALNNGGNKEVFINSSRVDESGSWIPYNPPVEAGYNRQLLPLSNGRLFIPQSGFFDPNNKNSINYGDMSVGYFKLVNVKSGKVLGVYEGGINEGDQLVQWSSGSNSLDQYWLIANAEAGYSADSYKTIVNAKSAKSIGIAANGENAEIRADSSSIDQHWTLEAVGDHYKIVNRKSGKILAVAQGSMTNGAQVIQWDYTGSADQHWQLVPDEGHITVDSYRLFNVKSGKALGIWEGSTTDGGRSVQWTSSNMSYDQNWFIHETAEGFTKLVNANSRKFLAVKDGSVSAGAHIAQWSDADSMEQQWMLEAVGDHYKIVNRKSGMILAVEQGSMADGAQVIQWNYTGSDDQHWNIEANIDVMFENSVADVQLDKSALTLKAGETETLVATVTPTDATNKMVKFTSDSGTVSLSSPVYNADTGETSVVITGISKGSAVITATTTDGGYRAQSTVIVTNLSGHYGPATMYTPPADAGTYGVLSPRTIQLKHNSEHNGKMYTTFEEVSNGQHKPTFPVFESTNNGATWTKVGEVEDTNNEWGMLNCPQIFEMPQTIGSLEKGTLIIIGNSVPDDRSQTSMDMYKSTDLGRTWEYVSTVDIGGTHWINGDPIWEPWMVVANDQLIVYYSDERDPAHSQKLVHRTTRDGVNWGPIVEDIVMPEQKMRPGMPIVAQLENGNYMMTYEVVGLPGVPNFYKINDNPEIGWNDLPSYDVIGGGSAYFIVLDDGRIVVNSYGSGDIFINSKNDGTGEWLSMGTPIGGAYNRGILQLNDGSLFILNGGGFVAPKHNSISYANMWIPSTDDAFKLVNVKTGKALAISNGDTKNGANAIQWTAGEALDQLWQSVELSNGYSTLVNVKTGKALGVWDGSQADGARIVQWNDTGSNDQQWTLEAVNNHYRIVNRNSGKLLAVSQGSAADGASIIQTTDSGADDQLWMLIPFSAPSGEIEVEKVEFDIPSLTLKVGETNTLQATVSPVDATNKTVRFTSSNEHVSLSEARYDAETGRTSVTVTGVSAGNATITAITADGGYTTTSQMKVTSKSAPPAMSTSTPEEKPSVSEGSNIVKDGSITVKAQSTDGGTMQVEVALSDLLKAAKSIRDGQLHVNVTTDSEQELSSINVKLPVQPIIEAGTEINEIIVDTGIVKVTISTDPTSGPLSSGSQQLELNVTAINPAQLSDEAKNAAKHSLVYDLSLLIDGLDVSNFKEQHAVVVELPYRLQPGEQPHEIVIYSINDEGEAEVIRNATYNEKTGKVTFSPNHFGQYVAANGHVAFTDLERVAWAKESIEALAARGVILGTGDGLFQPQRQVTRAEFIKMLMNVADLIEDEMSSSFTDVQQGAWYDNAVATAQKLKIVNGKSDGRFGIDDPITREDMAVMVFKVAAMLNVELAMKESDTPFTDHISISNYALDAVTVMQHNGLINGVGNGKFAPKANLDRAQAATIIYRLFQLLP
ncbi:RICIN domain-containing protein [Paenibacillus sp. SYP-B4298]|uniref:RICIN domain-containing protein n=1 Tax=Paenibacillus sp. SYP-B4298 TaxID=2996034 RepID=UPI0022DE4084|nr:RICIN domain-containing protein [Paenibacillus sp. SYP-B4298]